MSERDKKVYIILILLIIAIFGTFINYKPDIDLNNVESVEIIYNSGESIKINDIDSFVNSIKNEIKNFNRMIYNGSKDWQIQIDFKGDELDYTFIIQDNKYIKVNNKWYKTNTDLYELVNSFLKS